MIQFSLVSEISANQNPSTMLGMEDGSKIELSTTVNRSIEGGKKREIFSFLFVLCRKGICGKVRDTFVFYDRKNARYSNRGDYLLLF